MGKLSDISLFRPSELKRQRDRAEWLRPLEMLVGASLQDGTDCFVGRRAELRTLVNFTEVLRPQSVGEMETRLLRKASSSCSPSLGAHAMMLVAPSGLGKSALVAKFALTHALRSPVPFPFIYFNFGDPSKRSWRSLDLLVEAARQLSLQFPDYRSAFAVLRDEVREWTGEGDDLTGHPTEPDDPEGRQRSSETFFFSFRDQLKEASRWSDRTVMVFDTIECVQDSPDAMSNLKEFLCLLCANGFPQLRLLFAGRTEAEEFRAFPWLSMAKKSLALGPLSIAEAREMVNRLGAVLLREDWQRIWANKIAGCSSDPPGRREPATLRAGVEHICSASKELRAKIVDGYAELAINGASTNNRSLQASQ